MYIVYITYICIHIYIYILHSLCIYLWARLSVWSSCSWFLLRLAKCGLVEDRPLCGFGDASGDAHDGSSRWVLVEGKQCRKPTLLAQKSYGCVWKCCVPLNPMVLLIIIPIKNCYFIGNINPTFSDIPIWKTNWTHRFRQDFSWIKPYKAIDFQSPPRTWHIRGQYWSSECAISWSWAILPCTALTEGQSDFNQHHGINDQLWLIMSDPIGFCWFNHDMYIYIYIL